MHRHERLRALDGIRAVSVILVIFAHAAHALGARLRFDAGKLGVQMFFVLSGFLITSLLAEEHARTGRISLGGFYFRRTLRIFPPFYAFILLVVAAGSLGVIATPWSDVIHAVTYTMNYHRDRTWTLGHTWSLAVEEQFYLLWPITLVIVGVRRGLAVALAAIVIVPLLRVFTLRFDPAAQGGIGETFPTAAEALAAGCVLALGRDRLWAWAPYRRFLGSPLIALAPIVAVLLHAQSHHARFAFLVGYGAVSVCIALCIDFALRFPDGAVGRALSVRPLTIIGLASYSMYIWQQPFFDPVARAWWRATPVGMVLLVACVLFSYLVIEKGSMRLRLALEARRRAVEARPVEEPLPGA